MHRGQQPRAQGILAARGEHPAPPQRGHLRVQPRQRRQAAPEDDDVRVQQVDHAGQGARQPLRVALQGGLAVRIARGCPRGDGHGVERAAVPGGVVAGQGWPAQPRLDALRLAAVASQRSPLARFAPGQRVVAPFAGQPVGALQDAAMHGNARAGAGAQDRREDHLGACAGAVGGFRQRQAVGVVGQPHRLPDRRLDIGLQGPAVQAGRVAVLHAAIGPAGARRAQAHGDGQARREPLRHLPSRSDLVRHGLHRPGVVARRGGDPLAPDFAALRVEERALQLGAAQVDAQAEGRSHRELQIGSVRSISQASAAPATRGASVARTVAW